MIIDLIFSLVFPWLVAIFHLNKKDKIILAIMAPVASSIAFTINEIGFHQEFWEVHFFQKQELLVTLTYNLGLYPVLGSYLIFFINRNKNHFLIIIIFTFITTLIEWLFVLMGKVVYDHGWNEYWTFLSYFIAYTLCYYYYLYYKKIKEGVM